MTLALLGNTLLRTAIRQNLVTFPAQIQPFTKRVSGDMQERIVQLYFVRGWAIRNICDRYNLSKAVVQRLLSEWRVRAIESGYIQEIEPDGAAALIPPALISPAFIPRDTPILRDGSSRPISQPLPVLTAPDKGFLERSSIETCRELRRLMPGVAIVMFSDTHNYERNIEALDAGADHCVPGPFHVDEITSRIRATLRNASMETGHPGLHPVRRRLNSDPADCRQRLSPKSRSRAVGQRAGRVLIVGATAPVQGVLQSTLFGLGFDIGEAASGEEAIALSRIVRYDAILLDMNRPRMRGTERQYA